MIETILQKVFKKLTFNTLRLHFIGVIYLYYLCYFKSRCFIFFIMFESFHVIYEIINFSYYKKNNFYYIFNKKFEKKENIDFIYKSKNKDLYKIFQNNCFKTINFKFIHNQPFNKNIFCSKLNLYYIPYSLNSFKNFYCKKLSINNSHQISWRNYPLNNQIKTLNLKNNIYLSFHGIYNNLKNIDIGNNSIHTFDLFCPNLITLNLENNRLTSLDLRKSPLLKFINASNNLLENIKLVDVEYLDLSFNQLIVVPFIFSKIKYLSLKNNPIIPSLNHPNWNNFFNTYYPEFYQNDFDINIKNIYLHPELVHNPYLQNSTRLCLEELYEIFKNNKIPNGDLIVTEYQIGFFIFQNIDFTLKDLVNTILYLSKNDQNIKEILLEEIEEGQHYCLSGKISRIINSIMGFDLIKNKITISKNDEIIIQYDKLKKELLQKYKNENDDFLIEFKTKFAEILNKLELSPQTLQNWKSALN